MSATALSPATAHYREAFERLQPVLGGSRRASRGGDGPLCRTRVSRRAGRSLEVHEPPPPRIATIRTGRTGDDSRSTCRRRSLRSDSCSPTARRWAPCRRRSAALRSARWRPRPTEQTAASACRRRHRTLRSAQCRAEHRPAAAVHDGGPAERRRPATHAGHHGHGSDACQPPHRRAHGRRQPRTPADRPRRRWRTRAFHQCRARHRTRRRRAPHAVSAAAPGRACFPHRTDRNPRRRATPRS